MCLLLERRTLERAEKSKQKGLRIKIKGRKTKGILSDNDERNARQNHPVKQKKTGCILNTGFALQSKTGISELIRIL